MLNSEQYDELFEELYDSAFITSHYICKNFHDAQDIAQDVCLKYLLKKNDKDNPIHDPIRWGKAVARNATYKKQKEKSNISENLIVEIIPDKSESETKKDHLPDLPDFNKAEVKQLLNRDDYATYSSYLKHNGKTGLYAKANNLTDDAAKTRVYRMKRNLKAAYLRSIGHIGGKDIIDYQTNKKIIKFIKIFSSKIQQNDLKSLHKYFELYPVDNVPKLDICEYKVYELKITADGEYHIIYGYLDSQGAVQFINIYFQLDRNNQIRITKVNLPKVIGVIKGTIAECKQALPKSVKGITPVTTQEALDLVKTYRK